MSPPPRGGGGGGVFCVWVVRRWQFVNATSLSEYCTIQMLFQILANRLLKSLECRGVKHFSLRLLDTFIHYVGLSRRGGQPVAPPGGQPIRATRASGGQPVSVPGGQSISAPLHWWDSGRGIPRRHVPGKPRSVWCLCFHVLIDFPAPERRGDCFRLFRIENAKT